MVARSTSKRLSAVILCVQLFAAVGCLDLESGVVLNRDLTGKASFKMTVDVTPFVTSAIRATAGTAGELSSSDLTAEIAKQFSGGVVDVAELKSKLPPGVTLADSSQKLEGLKMTMVFTFTFTDVSKLPLIEVPMSKLNLVLRSPVVPFAFEVRDDGATVSVDPRPPASDRAKAALAAARKDVTAEAEQLGLSSLLKNSSLRMSMRFDIPQEVIEHNAKRKEGQSYFWDMKVDSFESLDKMPDPPTIKLKFKK